GLSMPVKHGCGRHSITTAAVEKIARVRAMAGTREIDVEVDGGITPETAPLVVRAGANVLVAGSAVFRGGNPHAYRANIAAIRNAAAIPRGEAARRNDPPLQPPADGSDLGRADALPDLVRDRGACRRCHGGAGPDPEASRANDLGQRQGLDVRHRADR